jgi:hypothetical protein
MNSRASSRCINSIYAAQKTPSAFGNDDPAFLILEIDSRDHLGARGDDEM